MIEFDLSEASPMRQSQKSYGTGQFSATNGRHQGSAEYQRAGGHNGMPGSSSVNLEKAYEELEREIYDIKKKLHQSIGNNEATPSDKYHR